MFMELNEKDCYRWPSYRYAAPLPGMRMAYIISLIDINGISVSLHFEKSGCAECYGIYGNEAFLLSL